MVKCDTPDKVAVVCIPHTVKSNVTLFLRERPSVRFSLYVNQQRVLCLRKQRFNPDVCAVPYIGEAGLCVALPFEWMCIDFDYMGVDFVDQVFLVKESVLLRSSSDCFHSSLPTNEHTEHVVSSSTFSPLFLLVLTLPPCAIGIIVWIAKKRTNAASST